MPDYKHYGKAQGGQLKYNNDNFFRACLNMLEGKEVEFLIRERIDPVTEDQMGYYRAGVIREASNSEQFGGWSEEDIHQYYQHKYLTTTVHRIKNGVTIEYPLIESTASLGKKRMAEYITRVIADLMQIGVEVKGPEHYFTGKYHTRKLHVRKS